MRLDEDDVSLLQEKLNVALVDALRVAYGSRYSSVPLETTQPAPRALPGVETEQTRASVSTCRQPADADATAVVLSAATHTARPIRNFFITLSLVCRE
jgi:hypothetical protein